MIVIRIQKMKKRKFKREKRVKRVENILHVPDARKQARFSLVLILRKAEASLISSAFGTILAKCHDGEK